MPPVADDPTKPQWPFYDCPTLLEALRTRPGMYMGRGSVRELRSWKSFRKAEERRASDEAGFDLWYKWYDEFRAATSTAQSRRST